ncbi:IS4 family transposase [Corallococcus sp. CA054B]|uniref:IS4 family transposase n=1 Tax=Corallococcus sp. CA054B TaxID=2316734 RepID=UPI000EA39260|nr:IS4 family transposase [Corallococcus sp. CA054B]RKG55846.1 IS4 family transposase [Corallococcus sp. CA054B]
MREHPLSPEVVEEFVRSVVSEDLHARRVLSLANATLGVIHAASLAVATVGRALAQARGLEPKHAIKQVDRLLSNTGVNVWELFASWVPMVLAQRTEAVVALDWTDFEPDDHSTICLSLLTKHGRATPLLWHTALKSGLAGNRNEAEDLVLRRLREVLPEGVKVTVLADRGFGDVELYELLKAELGFDFVIRFRECIHVEDGKGVVRTAAEWVPLSGRATTLKNARVTARRYGLSAVVVVKAPGMKDAWCLATSLVASATEVVKLYGRRFSIEESFRDAKDWRFGMGLSSARLKDPERRDRLLLVSAMAVALLTLLGAAAEDTGLDRTLKANTVARRTHSLFNQGLYFYGALPMMKEHRFEPLMRRFGELVLAQMFFREVYAVL